MSYLSDKMGLTVWDLSSDPYSRAELEANFEAIDEHDHSGTGKGVSPLPLDAIPLIDGTKIAPNSIETDHILDAQVTQDKLAANSVGSEQIKAGAVTQSELADNSVSTSKLQDSAVANAKLADGSVTNPKIAVGAVHNPQLADNAVNNAKIAMGAVTNPKLSSSSVDARVLGDNSVAANHIQANAVGASEIAAASVGVSEMATVPSIKLLRSTIQGIDPQTVVTVTWNVQAWNTDNMAHPDAIGVMIQTAGLYLISGGCLWEDPGGADSGGRRMNLRRNNTNIAGNGPFATLEDEPNAPHRVRCSATAIANCFPGDEITMHVWQTSNRKQIIHPFAHHTHLDVHWIGRTP